MQDRWNLLKFFIYFLIDKSEILAPILPWFLLWVVWTYCGNGILPEIDKNSLDLDWAVEFPGLI